MQVDLTAPDLFAENRFWPVLAWLRRNSPVHWHATTDGDGFWAVSRYDDIVAVYTDQESFSSRYGMRLDSRPDAVSAVAQRMLIVSDPPDHTHLKRVLNTAFAADQMPMIEPLVDRVVREVLHAAVDAAELDFLDVAKRIPNYVVCALMDIPRADWGWVGDVTTSAFEGADEDVRASAHSEVFLYFTDLLAERREKPGTDFVSRIAHERRATDEPGKSRLLTDEEIVFNCNGVLAGANETTRYSAAGGLLALIENPSQWAALRAAGPAAVPVAVEEILRWTVPGVHALRTVLRPTRIRDVPVAVGDKVTVWNVSANRDESIFDKPDQFRIDRAPNRHLTFGAGRHLCLGARLARLELGVFLRVLAQCVRGVELTGEPVYNASNFTWGLRSLPVRLLPG
jgi:cytochrome P450